MEFVAILIVAAAVFGVCFLVDKGFQKLFRSQAQHHSGLAVRLNKKYGAFGLILFVLGLAAVFMGLKDGWVLLAGGAIVMLMGIALVVYYMTYGIFYDADGFVYTTFGKKSVTYRYNQIAEQQVYVVQGGGIIVELHMCDGSAVSVQLHLQGAEDFLNKAFSGWCLQKGIRKEDCGFHDPANSCWFPVKEEV
jgi:hypothetical protein